jgi:hypothetical protein
MIVASIPRGDISWMIIKRRVLVGLTVEETMEFETLDGLPGLDETGDHIAWEADGMPATTREKRWLELYTKHDEAWKQWMLANYVERGGLTAR